MKKIWNVFWITETLILAGTLAAAIALRFVSVPLGAAAVISGALAAAAYGLHYRSLGVTFESGRFVVQKGFIVRSRREIPIESILMYQELTLFGRTLYTALTTAGGTAVLFCRVGADEISRLSENNAGISPLERHPTE